MTTQSQIALDIYKQAEEKLYQQLPTIQYALQYEEWLSKLLAEQEKIRLAFYEDTKIVQENRLDDCLRLPWDHLLGAIQSIQ